MITKLLSVIVLGLTVIGSAFGATPPAGVTVSETFQASGIGEALSAKDKEPYATAAADRGILLKGGFGGPGGGVFREVMELELALKCDDEVRPGFMLALRSEIERIIASKGATINGGGADNQGRRFHYDYQWRANEGIIYVYLVDDKQESRLIVLLYEHRR